MTFDDAWWSRWRESGNSLILHVDLRPDRERQERAFALLDEEERARWERFVHEGARRRFALCRAALRINLCDRLGCSNRELSFGYLEHGKPFAIVNGIPSDASFNVSHSDRHGLIGFAKRDGLGVDVEVRAPGRDFDSHREPGLHRARTACPVRGGGGPEGGPLLPFVEPQGGAHQGAGHRFLAESVPLRSAAADARR